MKTFSDFYNRIARMQGDVTDSTSLGYYKDWLNEAMLEINHLQDWWFLEESSSIATTSGTQEYILPADVMNISTARYITSTGHVELGNETRKRIVHNTTTFDTSTNTGTPTNYWLYGASPVSAQPSSASTLSLTSSSASDTTQTVRIYGTTATGNIGESVTLTGTTAAVSTNSYSKIIRLSKSASTVGYVTCTSNSGAVTNIVLDPADIYLNHRKIFIYPIPGGTYTVGYDYIRRMSEMTADDDVCELPPEYHEILIAGAMLRAGQYENDSAKVGKWRGWFKYLLDNMSADNWEQTNVDGLPHIKMPKEFD